MFVNMERDLGSLREGVGVGFWCWDGERWRRS